MGDVAERDPEDALEILQLGLHVAAQLEVERAERLVEQQHLGPVDDGARERDALLLAARELARPRLLATAELHERDRLARRARGSRRAGRRASRSPNATFS